MVIRFFILFLLFSLQAYSGIEKIYEVRKKITLTYQEHELYRPKLEIRDYVQHVQQYGDSFEFSDFQLKLWYFLGKIEAYIYLKQRKRENLVISRNAFYLCKYFGYEENNSNKFLKLLGVKGKNLTFSKKSRTQTQQDIQKEEESYTYQKDTSIDEAMDASLSWEEETGDGESEVDQSSEVSTEEIGGENIDDIDKEWEDTGGDDIELPDDGDDMELPDDGDVSDRLEDNDEPEQVGKLGKKFAFGYSYISWQELISLVNQGNLNSSAVLNFRGHSLGINFEFLDLGRFHIHTHAHFVYGISNTETEPNSSFDFFEANTPSIGATFGLGLKYDIEKNKLSLGLGVDALYRQSSFQTLGTGNTYTTDRETFLGISPYLDIENRFGNFAFFTRTGYADQSLYWQLGMHLYVF